MSPAEQRSEHRRILIVDDEPQITRVLRTSLDAHGYDLRVANDGDTALQIARDWSPDLMITDLSMPVMDGLELCRRFRQKSNAPIIVLSVKGEERTKVQALDAGADDYVTKPFSVNELLARVRANLRRVAVTKEESVEPVENGDFYINPQARMVRVRGKEIHLTPKEFDLLVFMARHPNKVLTHRVLLNAVWGGESVQQPEYLRVFINQLRKKVESSDKPQYIVTDPWVGYRFHPTGEPPL